MSLPILSCTCIMWSGSLKVQSYPFSLALSHVSGLKRRIRLVLSQSGLDLCVESCWGWRSLYSFGVLLISLVWGSSILILDLWWLILYSEVRLNLIPIICFAAIFPRAGFISIMSKTNPSGSLVDENFGNFGMFDTLLPLEDFGGPFILLESAGWFVIPFYVSF